MIMAVHLIKRNLTTALRLLGSDTGTVVGHLIREGKKNRLSSFFREERGLRYTFPDLSLRSVTIFPTL